jgi:type IV secretory pathway VirB10-like protein
MQNAKCKMQNLTLRTRVPFAFCILHFAFASALALAVAGCGTKAGAQTVPDGPPLAVPLPPAHEIAIEQVVEAAPPEPPPVLEPAPPVPPKPTVTRTQVSPEREKPAPVAAQPATAPQTPPAEATTVRAASAADERRVREQLSKAATDLNRVDYKRLSTEGKSQYDQSKRFSDEAQQAIKVRDFLLALTLADKAATLAAELVR